jgi:hypothetical protein
MRQSSISFSMHNNGIRKGGFIDAVRIFILLLMLLPKLQVQYRIGFPAGDTTALCFLVGVLFPDFMYEHEGGSPALLSCCNCQGELLAGRGDG